MSSNANSLPAWLQQQAQRQPRGIALRHKHLGVWQVRRWATLDAEVRALAAALAAHGFAAGAELLVLSRPRPEALLLALAAQWLGGAAALLDPLDAGEAQVGLLRELNPDFVFAEGLDELLRVQRAGLRPTLLLYAEARGLSEWQGSATQAYAALLATPAASQFEAQARGAEVAFVFYRQTAQGGLERHTLSHAELLDEGQRLVRAEGLGAGEEALAARAFAAAGQARYLLAPWLIAGFRLNFPESLETRDRDRRELGPSLLLGTRETYGRLYAQALQRMPLPGSLARRLLDWALADRPGLLRASLGHWLLRRPLRDVLGFSRTRVPLLVGAPLAAEAQRFFAALGVAPRAWPLAESWQAAPPRRAETTWPRGQEPLMEPSR